MRWPIGRIPMSLSVLRPVMAHPALAGQTPDIDALSSFGVVEIRRSRRMVGKYSNFTSAEALQPKQKANRSPPHPS